MKTVYVETPVSEKPKEISRSYWTNQGELFYDEQGVWRDDGGGDMSPSWYLRLVPVSGVPSEEDAGAIAVNIASTLTPKLAAHEEAFFIAGFQEGEKYFHNLMLPTLAALTAENKALSEERDRMKEQVSELKEKAHTMLFHFNAAYPLIDAENDKQTKVYLSYHELKNALLK